MNLKFGLLWLEDQYSPAELDNIKNAARAHGFQIEIVNRPNGDDLKELSVEQERHYPFDLILIDLDLAADGNGADEARRARDLFPATPILFYSGKKNRDGLVQLIQERQVEGVFISHRNDFTKRTGELIGHLAASFNRLPGMRGLAARVVAECDDHYRAILTTLGKHSDLEAKIAALLDEEVQNAQERSVKGYSSDCKGGLAGRIGSRAVTSMTLHKVARKITGYEEFRQLCGASDALAAARRECKDYTKDVLEVRNTLGHALESRTDNGWEIANPKGEDITVARFPQIRETFLVNLEAIKRMLDIVTSESLLDESGS
ncbi:response regulator [Hwanghaeella grinnelliae]|uniref:Response regulator n=1 Tax=Hwanghaeella grinnelliae TaxID=2500179 RepID=A0A3S2VQT0_9PROT|nr:response regulator [Hwanghaeella grinnelliae]RVU38136.1 response regulator [Hwanghaeella grinnelliae]